MESSAFPRYLSNNDKGILNRHSLAFYRLFKHEITNILFENENVLAQCLQYMKDAAFYKAAFDKIKNCDRYPSEYYLTCRDCVYHLMREGDKGTKWLLDYLYRDHPSLAERMSGFGIDTNAEGFNIFKQFFMPEADPDALDKISASLNVKAFVDILSRDMKTAYEPFFAEYNKYKDLIRRDVQILSQSPNYCDIRVYSHEYDHRYFADIFLRNLPKCNASALNSDAWVFDFVQLLARDDCNRAVLRVFMKDYKSKIEARRQEKILAQTRDPLERLEEVTVTECRTQEEADSRMYKEWSANELNDHDAPTFTLRSYQHELARDAVQGKNVVIVAPTGCGKTLIAGEIARQHFESRFAVREKVKELLEMNRTIHSELLAESKARVVFVVPTVPLVEQQQNKFRAFLRERYLCIGLHGGAAIGDEETRKSLFLGAHLIIMTPQLLINMLKSVRRCDRIYMCDITLLILDECHHTIKQSAYNSLMDIVNSSPVKPQIVGMTASLGTGKTMNLSAVCDHIYGICAAHNATKICDVQANKAELNKYVQLPEDKVIRCDRQRDSPDSFHSKLMVVVQRIEKQVHDLIRQLGKQFEFSERETKFEKAHRCLPRYAGLIESLRNRIQQMQDMDASIRVPLLNNIKTLKLCAKFLLLDELLPSCYVYSEMCAEIKELPDRHTQSMELLCREFGELKRSAETEVVENKRILQELRELLGSQLREMRDSRILIFVKERALATKLADCLNHDSFFHNINADGVIAGYVTSAQNKSGKTTQTQTEQRKAIQDFNEGDIQVMVATSVVEEGLDVQTCNLIIKYNMTGNTVSEIQKRGRARAAGSKSILLVVTEAVEEKEYENRVGEMMMSLALKEILQKSEANFTQKCEEVREKRKKDLEEAMYNVNKLQIDQKIFSIKCRTCETMLGTSIDMRTIVNQNYILCSESIWSKITFVPLKKPKTIGELLMVIGNACCAHRTSDENDASVCQQILGTVVSFADTFLLQLKLDGVQLFNDQSELQGYRKWKDVKENLFYIQEITENDLRLMQSRIDTATRRTFVEALEATKQEAQALLKTRNERARRAAQPVRDYDDWDVNVDQFDDIED